MRRIIPVLAVAFALLVTSAWAQAREFSTLEERMSAADFRRAGLDKLSDQELAKLNAWLAQDAELRGVATAPAGAERVPAPAAAGVAAPTAEQDADRRGFRVIFGAEEREPIRSHLPGEFTGWSGEHTFRLANGQTWRSTEPGNVLAGVHLQDPAVTIRKGAIGGWRLQVDGYNSTVRVQRIE